jgi:peptidoglycan/xylan/chitin deacetylase (PgdA/CDA1 family)
MLHRLTDAERGVLGNSEAALRGGLDYLRRSGYQLVSLDQVFSSLFREGPPLRSAVAFTIDDGYEDQATRFAPIFAEYQCPVTTFVTSGFLDGELWFWWDRLEYVFKRTRREQLVVPLPGRELRYDLEDEASRERAQLDLTERLKTLPADDMEHCLREVAEIADVAIPDEPPDPYRPMTWDQLRSCEGMGMTFGPHTVTHPILSRTTDTRSVHELSESWRRLCEQTENAVPIFCYPNGQEGDFGTREFATLAGLNLKGAVVGAPGYASGSKLRDDEYGRFQVRRFSFPESLVDLAQYASGFERAKQLVRREAA